MLRPFAGLWLSAAIVVLSGASRPVLCAEFTPVAGWDQQLFPSYLIATAALREEEEPENEDANEVILGDRRGVLGIRLLSPDYDTPITVTITGDTLLEPSTYTGTLENGDTNYVIYPQIKYKYAALAKNKQSVPVAVTFRVECGEEEPSEQTLTLTLRSVNDCPFTVAEGEEDGKDVSFVFAAYVNEQHPFVDKVLREALDRGVVDSFTGYQSGDPAEVYRQVYALWDALSERDVRYSNITTSAADSATVSSQHVRLIDESINNAQANCVDGSVLLASLLRKIDIEPLLVFVPGHCYLAFYLDAEGKQLAALETTLIGSVGEETCGDVGELKNVVDQTWSKTNSWSTFVAALNMGNEDLEANRPKMDEGSDPDYQLVSIASARRLGVLPIAFDSPETFQATTGSEEE